MQQHEKLEKSNLAELILLNGTFITMDPSMPTATALAITDGYITWIGDQKDASTWIGTTTQTIDLKGAFAYPGFIDTHIHILYTGERKTYLQLGGLDKKQILEKVKEQAAQCHKDEYILGVDWDDHSWPKDERPTAEELNHVAPNNPVILYRADTHAIWVNSLLLRQAHINASTPDPAGGKIEKTLMVILQEY